MYRSAVYSQSVFFALSQCSAGAACTGNFLDAKSCSSCVSRSSAAAKFCAVMSYPRALALATVAPLAPNSSLSNSFIRSMMAASARSWSAVGSHSSHVDARIRSHAAVEQFERCIRNVPPEARHPTHRCSRCARLWMPVVAPA